MSSISRYLRSSLFVFMFLSTQAASVNGQSRPTDAQLVFNKASSTVVMINVVTQDGTRQGSAVAVRTIGARPPSPGATVFYTNWHVVQAAKILTTSVNGATYKLEVVEASPELDMAIVVGSGLFIDPAVIAKNPPSIGDAAFAVGNPRGLEKSISKGIISGLRHSSGTSFIQTTAAISPGSSGGGLFDATGNLVGITTLRIGDAGESLNFAISVLSFEQFKDAKLAADIVAVALQTLFRDSEKDVAVARSEGFFRWLYHPDQAQTRNYFAYELNNEFRSIGSQQAASKVQTATSNVLEAYEIFRRSATGGAAKSEGGQKTVLVCQIKDFPPWTIELDFVNNTINGKPARFTDSSIEIGDSDSKFIINRFASTITASNKHGSRTGDCRHATGRAF